MKSLWPTMETTLLSVQKNIFVAMERQDCIAVTLLELALTFDITDHQILLGRLNEWFGFGGDALKWVVCYLLNRS